MASDSLLREAVLFGGGQPPAPRGSAVDIVIPVRNEERDLVWSHSDAAVLAYMDVDLSTDLNARSLPRGWPPRHRPVEQQGME